MHEGNGPGVSGRSLGEQGGAAEVTLAATNVPPHTHPVLGADTDADRRYPGDAYYANSGAGVTQYGTADASMSGNSVAASTGGAHENRQPYAVVMFCIALQGTFPSRS